MLSERSGQHGRGRRSRRSRRRAYRAARSRTVAPSGHRRRRCRIHGWADSSRRRHGRCIGLQRDDTVTFARRRVGVARAAVVLDCLVLTSPGALRDRCRARPVAASGTASTTSCSTTRCTLPVRSCAVARPAAVRADRLAWRALALALNVLGVVTPVAPVARMEDEPFPSLADAFYLGLPAAVRGARRRSSGSGPALPRQHVAGRRRRRAGRRRGRGGLPDRSLPGDDRGPGRARGRDQPGVCRSPSSSSARPAGRRRRDPGAAPDRTCSCWSRGIVANLAGDIVLPRPGHRGHLRRRRRARPDLAGRRGADRRSRRTPPPARSASLRRTLPVSAGGSSRSRWPATWPACSSSALGWGDRLNPAVGLARGRLRAGRAVPDRDHVPGGARLQRGPEQARTDELTGLPNRARCSSRSAPFSTTRRPSNRPRSCSSTWTASRRSTTASATTPATTSCVRSAAAAPRAAEQGPAGPPGRRRVRRPPARCRAGRGRGPAPSASASSS